MTFLATSTEAAVPFEVRAAHANDDIAVSALIAEYAATFVRELGDQDVVGAGMRASLDSDNGGLFVAEWNREVVGCVAFEALGDGRARMRRMYVMPDARGQGIGRALAEAVIEAARRSGAHEMVLDTTPTMEAARNLYKSLGFEEFPGDYASPCLDAVYMRRPLT